MNIKIPKEKYNNLISKKQEALYDLKNNKNIALKGTEKVPAVVFWDKEN